MANPPGSIRVAFVSPGWPAEAMPNGVVSYIATLVPAMRGLGARCHVLTARPLSDELEPFVRPIETGRSLLSRVLGRVDPEGWPHRAFCAALLEQVNRLWTTEGLDLLEVEDSFGWARLLARKCPVPLVVRLHGPWFLNGQANGLPADASFHRRDRWEKQGLLWAGAVTAPSRHVLEETCRHFAIEFPWSQVIPNPVEIPDEPDRWNLQECQPNRIAFVGRFDRHKGGDTMIQAFAQVLKRRPDAHLDFVGPDRGYIDDAGRTWKFDEFLRKNLAEAQRAQVTYHGFLPRAQAAKMRKKTLVTVVPSRYETFGLAAAEAMAAGCPLVAAAVGGLAELVRDGQTALTVRPGDSNDLAEKVLNLLDNPHQAERLGEQAAREARRRFAPAVVAEQTLDFYQRVIQSSTRQRAARPLASSAKPLNVPQP